MAPALGGSHVTPIQLSLPSPLEPLDLIPGMKLWVKRDDLIHPIISGNKWRKLEGFFHQLDRHRSILTFGGAYSNHLPAVACAAHQLNHRCILIVRGEELSPSSNPILQYCAELGASLFFVSREDYLKLRFRQWQPTLHQLRCWDAENATILPEGGAGAHVVRGCQRLWTELSAELAPAHIVIAAGTGATASGLLSAMPCGASVKLHVISALRAAKRERAMVKRLAAQRALSLHWEDELYFGGYGRKTEVLLRLSADFKRASGFPVDLTYNAKVWAYLKRTPLEGQVVWVHSGGFRPPAPLISKDGSS